MNKVELKKSIGTRFKRVRLSLGWKLYQMARELFISPISLSRNEKGIHSPDIYSLYIIATELGYSLDWLICGRGPEKFRVVDESRAKTAEPGEAEVRELVQHMEKIPLLKYRMLAQFHQFKEDHRELIAREMS